MAFKGMNPDEGRDVANAVNDAGVKVLDAIDAATTLVNSVEWIGPDYEAYRDDWNTFVSSAVNDLVEGFKLKADELNMHADQQDDTSNQG